MQCTVFLIKYNFCKTIQIKYSQAIYYRRLFVISLHFCSVNGQSIRKTWSQFTNDVLSFRGMDKRYVRTERKKMKKGEISRDDQISKKMTDQLYQASKEKRKKDLELFSFSLSLSSLFLEMSLQSRI